jgi:hypothetical protein
MKRVINELTADEVRRGTGVKVGDFGTGSRTYVTRYERDPARAGDGRTLAKVCFFASVIIGIAALVWVELTLASTSQMLEEAMKKAVELDGPASIDASHNGKLVFFPVHNNIKLAGSPPADDFFGLNFPTDVATARRETEYCQWEEQSHTREIKEGTNPENGKEKIRREKEYFYHKGWRTHLVSSAFFDSPVAYHNPSRDPSPTKTFTASGGIDLLADGKRQLIISTNDFENALLPWQTVTLYKEGVRKLSQNALKEGFNEADHKYIYSRVPEDGFTGNPLVKAGASYLLDGVVDVNNIAAGTGFESLLAGAGLDWITKGTCKAGDIRVHFETRGLPQSASVLGMVTGNGQKIVPFTYTNGYSKVFASSSAVNELSSFAKQQDNETRRWAWMCRAGLAVVLLLGAWAGSDIYAPKAGTLPLFATIAAIGLGGAWAYSYGFDNKAALGVLAAGILAGVYTFLIVGGSSSEATKKSNDDNSVDNKTGEKAKTA